MLGLKSKEKRDLLKWSKQNNPLMYFVLSMDGLWDTDYEDPENISVHFLKYWPAVKNEIIRLGFKTPDDIRIDYFADEDLSVDMAVDLFNLLNTMPYYFEEARRFAECEAYCREMLTIFDFNDDDIQDVWGHIGYDLDRQGRTEERDALFAKHEMTAVMAAYYSMCFLERRDADRAEEILAPFKDSDNNLIEARLAWLEEIRRGWEEDQ